LIHILSDDYVVWDISVIARYKKPAKTRIYGEFIFSAEGISKIKEDVSLKKEIDIVKTMNLVEAK
jgi:hypothetical protein